MDLYNTYEKYVIPLSRIFCYEFLQVFKFFQSAKVIGKLSYIFIIQDNKKQH